MKAFIFGFAALIIAGSAMADSSDNTSVIHDKPGFLVHLDVDKVLASTDLTSQCGIVPARLDYLDHSGQQHELDYQVYGAGCTRDN